MDSGTLIDQRYRLDRLIAAGGMGSVWRARDELLEREVALKTLFPGLDGTDQSHDRFKREAQTLASLKGPGVVEVYDFGRHEDGDRTVPYLVMELVEGVSLAELLRREERLDPARTMRIIAEAAEALAVAHERGVVHRDVKPGNILVGADDRVKVVDFGISLLAHRARLTPSDTVLGTAPYVSPEQLRDRDVTGAADLYSLGAVAYECLTGSPPFDATDPAAVIHGHLYSDPPALPESIPAGVAGVVEKLLLKAPEERWPSGEVLAAACRAAATGAHPVRDTTMNLAPFLSRANQTLVESRPVPPPGPGATQVLTGSAQEEEKEEKEPKRRRRLFFLLVPIVLVVPVTTTALVLTPWDGWAPGWAVEDPSTTATADATPTGAASAAASDTATEASTPPETAETSTAETEGQGGDGEGTGQNEPGPGADDEEPAQEEAPASGTVPDTQGMNSLDAQEYLNEQGFTDVTLYNQQVEWFGVQPGQCQVVAQEPAGGTTAAYGDQIRVGYYIQVGASDDCT